MRRSLTLVLTLALAATARAATVEIKVARAPRGIETGLALDGPYARALEAVRAGEYRRAGELMREARAELRRAGASGAMAPARARSLLLKCDIEERRIESLVLLERESARGTAFEHAFDQATALHDLYLTSRALAGRDDAVLYRRAAGAYHAALQAASAERVRDELAILAVEGWAGLLAAGGHRREALAELARVPAEVRLAEPYVLATAIVYAETGQRERALQALATARDTLPSWPEWRAHLRVANDFDALRDDPRFARLVGEEE